ncbi:MAG: L,D-transpeptidase [Verrucomicrobiae bacterium]|nr:L,D-transpeptidase [Verrucomicrobiae bacterium]
MPRPGALPRSLLLTCRRHRIPLTRDVLTVSVPAQRVAWFRSPSLPIHPFAPAHTLHRTFRASTSRFGIGQIRDSLRTPLGLHRIAARIGHGWPVGTVFRARQPVGRTWAGMPHATIAHRILWLEGLEPGFNRGGPVDTFSRYIYVHGLADEPSLGRPASQGCIHLAAADLIPLHDQLPLHTLVWIHPKAF